MGGAQPQLRVHRKCRVDVNLDKGARVGKLDWGEASDSRAGKSEVSFTHIGDDAGEQTWGWEARGEGREGSGDEGH